MCKPTEGLSSVSVFSIQLPQQHAVAFQPKGLHTRGDFQAIYRQISLIFLATCRSELENLFYFLATMQIARLIVIKLFNRSRSYLTTKSNNCDKSPEKKVARGSRPVYDGLKRAITFITVSIFLKMYNP